MATERFKQFAIVRSDSAQSFENQLNARMYELREYNPEVLFSENGETLTATIEYVKKVETAPRMPDPERDGIVLSCSDCPYFEPTVKKDGTVDGRAKYGGCKFSEFGKTYRDSNACKLLYQMIGNGGIRLCLSDSEF